MQVLLADESEKSTIFMRMWTRRGEGSRTPDYQDLCFLANWSVSSALIAELHIFQSQTKLLIEEI